MPDVKDLQIGALKYGQMVKMAASVGGALHRLQYAAIHGAMWCAATPSIARKIIEAQELLQQAENEIAERRKAYGE
jgi:hypothetical protein